MYMTRMVCTLLGLVALSGPVMGTADVGTADVRVDWSKVITRTSTAATIEVDVMPFLARTDYGGPFNAYYEALENLGAEFVRFAPWFPNPRAVVTELTRPDCNATTPASNWNSTYFDAVMRDFMAAVCGPDAAVGVCKHSVAQQLSTMPAWMYVEGLEPPDILPEDPWDTPTGPRFPWRPFGVYESGVELVDKTCGEMARYMGRLVGWYTGGGFHDDCGHWHESGLHYKWWGLSVLNEDEHKIRPRGGEGYTVCYDAIALEVNPDLVLIGPEFVQESGGNVMDAWTYFLNSSNHVDGKPPPVASYHWSCCHSDPLTQQSSKAAFALWDGMLQSHVPEMNAIKTKFGNHTEIVLNEFIISIGDWCDCRGVEHLCVNSSCPVWYDPATAAGDPNLQHGRGVRVNRTTWSWNTASAFFAYGFGTLAEFGYKYVAADQLVGGPWPDNEPQVSSMDWNNGQVNAKYWVTNILAKTVGTAEEKSLFKAIVANASSDEVRDAVYVLPYVKSAKKGILVVNKMGAPLELRFHSIIGGSATVVDVDLASKEPGFNPPSVRRIGKNGKLLLGPYAVAVATELDGVWPCARYTTRYHLLEARS